MTYLRGSYCQEHFDIDLENTIWGFWCLVLLALKNAEISANPSFYISISIFKKTFNDDKNS